MARHLVQRFLLPRQRLELADLLDQLRVHDPQLLDIRARASVDAVTAARAKAAAGDTAGAMRLAKLATQLDPNDGPAAALLPRRRRAPAPDG